MKTILRQQCNNVLLPICCIHLSWSYAFSTATAIDPIFVFTMSDLQVMRLTLHLEPGILAKRILFPRLFSFFFATWLKYPMMCFSYKIFSITSFFNFQLFHDCLVCPSRCSWASAFFSRLTCFFILSLQRPRLCRI